MRPQIDARRSPTPTKTGAVQNRQSPVKPMTVISFSPAQAQTVRGAPADQFDLKFLITNAERDAAVQAAELAKQTTAQLTARLADENPELLHNKMVIGGGLIIGGILFGLLLPLITPKRRRNDRWM